MVKLLKNIAQQDGQCKQKDFLRDGSFCQRIAVAMQNNPFFQKVARATIMLYAPANELSRVGNG